MEKCAQSMLLVAVLHVETWTLFLQVLHSWQFAAFFCCSVQLEPSMMKSSSSSRAPYELVSVTVAALVICGHTHLAPQSQRLLQHGCYVIINSHQSRLKPPQTTTNNHNQPQPTTNNHKQPQTTTNNHKQPQTTTNNHKQPQTTTNNHKQPQTTTTNHN